MNTVFCMMAENRPDHYSEYDVTWQSAARVLRDERMVIIDYGSSPESLRRVPKRIEVVKAVDPVHSDMWWGIDRFLSMWKLSNGPAEDKILHVDCRDMLFQRNPFDDLKPGLTVMSEGILHRDCAWNRGDHNTVRQNMAPQTWANIDDWPVLCPGAFGGDRRMVRWLVLMLFTLGTMQRKGGTDQGTINMVVNQFLSKHEDVTVSDPRVDDWCLGGHDYRITKCTMQDGNIVCPATGRPYAMVHQWDRTEWRDPIMANPANKCT